MAKKLDATRIEGERKKGQQLNRKEEARQNMQAAIARNKRGERKMRYIPPAEKKDAAQDAPALKVAAYIRVSTQEEAQMGSFEMQKVHFLNVIRDNPRYELVRLYCDEGISGTQMHNRAEFQQMIADAKEKKIELILTKSITRIGRNIVDTLTTLRILDALDPPVRVIFEAERINTSDGSSKLIIAILAAAAEMESYQKSEAVKAGIRWRMQEGIYKFAVRNTLGYYRDYTGTVKIEPAEAEIVRFIYDSFLEGSSPNNIAQSLTTQGIKSPKGMDQWRSGTIKGILSNEKYCGDVEYQKTYTKDYLTHKSAKNSNVLGKYYWENAHPAIIKRSDWESTQVLLREKKWSTRRVRLKEMPKRFVIAKIKTGPLRGYYLLDATWDKDEREKFIHVITTLSELEGSQ